MFGFEVNGVQPGGAAEVKLFLPEGFNTNTYYKQDLSGALQRFDFDGTTGAVFNGNVVTLHLIDGGRGDADGIANGAILDPGGPGDPLPYVRLAALDPTAAKYRVDAVHGTSTGAFVVYRGGDLSEALTVNYAVNSSSTAVAGQDYQALTGTAVIQPGQATAGIIIRPLDNASANSTKTVGISLSESPDYVVGTIGTPVVTISETSNDYPLPYMPMGQPGIGVLTLDANAGELPNESSTGLDLVFRSAVVTEMVPGGGMTWTNPAAVTAFYSVSQTGTASGDYQSLSGSASLPYAVFASEVKILPIDDPTLEGPEDVTISLTQNASYAVVPPGTGKVTIQDNEEIPIAPQANPDEYAMGAEESSHSFDVGVLHNDYLFSPGAATAVLKADPNQGTVVLNPNGSFVYTPGAGIQSTGGNDSFQYVASQNGLESAWTLVTIHVVKVTITTVKPDGTPLPHGENMTTGAYVPINANNDNGSVVTNGIPTNRDFNVAPLRLPIPLDGFLDDPDLVAVNVSVNPNAGLPGFFSIAVANNGPGQIRLWRQPSKQNHAEGVYTQANLPSTFYMEGFEPSATVFDRPVVSVSYVFVGQLGLPMAAGSDRLAAAVTPVVDFFNIATGSVVFEQVQVGNQVQNVGLVALGAFNNPANLGALFDAQVWRQRLSGEPHFIQNVTDLLNGTRGAGNGFTFNVPQGQGIYPIPNRNWVPVPVWDRTPNKNPFPWEYSQNQQGNYVVVQPQGAPNVAAPTFPLLDMAVYDLPPEPYYTGRFKFVDTVPVPLYMNAWHIQAEDGPGTQRPVYPRFAPVPVALRETPQHMYLTNIDIEFQFRVYLEWRFADGTRYTIATRDWNAVLRATGPGGGQGLNAIDNRSGVFSPVQYVLTHDNPVADRPTFNYALESEPNGVRLPPTKF